ncbi:hypothetical protein GURASL_13610 [Geotalea uraniireducens]|uniref:DUF2635 domain-containing protein n=1 Tax=Geotalea uraniireducens TaxID=351604 RepID=A0ABM8EJA0_9BACT|nr:hypothetical protein [Geotalea uraniireducens]BDV42438.1 hypothetical protein GURASL_13610 [Geotalea uraniireducens]
MAKTDTNYRYSGPLTGVTLDDGREVMLHPGGEISLPANNHYVKALVAQRLLTEVPKQSPVQEVPKPQTKKEEPSAS